MNLPDALKHAEAAYTDLTAAEVDVEDVAQALEADSTLKGAPETMQKADHKFRDA